MARGPDVVVLLVDIPSAEPATGGAGLPIVQVAIVAGCAKPPDGVLPEQELRFLRVRCTSGPEKRPEEEGDDPRLGTEKYS